MRNVFRWLLAVPVVVALACAIPSGARADEAPKDDSAASKAFRDAWWAETGGGNLTQALELYAKATDAEGPAAVRARALYRRAVVLQRIGKTEDAIRALERLAKDFAGEAELLTQARARLTEWTAVDLRSSFGDWFKRYQYSPEFQAKVVDLVLKLGGMPDAASAAERELLNIGEASVPALLEGAKNPALLERTVKLLLQLGTVPDQVTEAVEWTNDFKSWSTLLALPPARRAALAARLKGGSLQQDALRAALGDSEAIVAWLTSPSPAPQVDNSVRSQLLWAFVNQPGAEAFKERLSEAVTSQGIGPAFRASLANSLLWRKWVTPERIRAWATGPEPKVRNSVWYVFVNRDILTPAEAWPLVAELGGRLQAGEWGRDEPALAAAFVKALEGAPWPEELDRAADMVVTAGGALQVQPEGRYVEVLGRAFERASDDDTAAKALQAWSNATPAPGGIEPLVRWSRSAPTPRRREFASQKLFDRMTPVQAGAAVAVLTASDLEPGERANQWRLFFATLYRSGFLLEEPDRVRELLDALNAVPVSAVQPRATMASALMGYIDANRLKPDALIKIWLEQPDKIPLELGGYRAALREAVKRTGRAGRSRADWIDAWSRWTVLQREHATVLLEILEAKSDPGFVAFLREQLRAVPRTLSVPTRRALLAQFETLELDDVRAAYDLTSSDDLKEAVRLLLPSGQLPPRLKATPEAFEAFRPGLRPEMYDGIVTGMAAAFRHIPSVQRELVAALLAHPMETVAGHAFDILLDRSSPEDEDLWLKALGNADKDVRARAAAGMERLPTENVKRALVKALDDPHPDVRAAVLTTLEAIQKHEELKARWRERVK